MENESDGKSKYSEFVRKYFWLIRPCEEYKRERTECTSVKGRFHQYFVHGSLTDCNEWQRNVDRCDLCISNFDNKACEEIIESERARKMKRIEAHLKNDVWEKRKEPPRDWVKPVPEWWIEENKDSYFMEKAKDFEKDIRNVDIIQSKFCRIF